MEMGTEGSIVGFYARTTVIANVIGMKVCRSHALQPPSTGVCCVPHVSLTDRPCVWSCMDQETAVFELELASIPRLRRVQKQRAQFFKVRARDR